ncbi:hypothetical protein [Labrys wisconsinensis]|uniref:Transposase n=1 Tax=Labrys wisconsinensis TaxID=425677 RepID=A0ABU0J8I2_9HYPH|nr:hypothetical protein [Labrys wisconsinensis]MDQ0470586.1 hypothetical protein [Labrys wisconsinensis]
MRKYPELRPRLYAEEIDKLIRRVAAEEAHVDLHAESRRIFGCSGVTIDTTLRDLAEMNIPAGRAIPDNENGAAR